MNSLFRLIPRKYEIAKYDRPDVRSDSDIRRYPQWLKNILEYHKTHGPELQPTVKEFQDLIESDTRIKLLVGGMCDELVADPAEKPKDLTPPVIQSYHDLLRLLDYMLRVPPLWDTHMFMVGLEASPFTMLMKEPIQTACGFALFLDLRVNEIMGCIVTAWATFLESPASASCLNDSPIGWFGPEALLHLTDEANLGGNLHTFEDIYICDPSRVDRGFVSWDDFFTRQFRDGMRPVADPEDDTVVANACEAIPWRIVHNAQYEDRFWAKGGPYSLKEMLSSDELGESFIGGTIYQAYLGALAYHRWHSPVRGKVVKAYKIPGTYFSKPLHKGFGKDNDRIDPNDSNWSQSYLSAVATRAVIFIEADNPDIGMVAIVPIGMSEVSSCEITVSEGQRVQKGDQVGMFHFGGSTHCVLFGRDVELTELPDTGPTVRNLPVKGLLARVARKS